MVRTQIYLTEVEHEKLHGMARRTGASLSELIREAIDSMLAQSRKDDRLTMLRQARGVWKDRRDLPNFRTVRHELDRTRKAR